MMAKFANEASGQILNRKHWQNKPGFMVAGKSPQPNNYLDKFAIQRKFGYRSDITMMLRGYGDNLLSHKLDWPCDR